MRQFPVIGDCAATLQYLYPDVLPGNRSFLCGKQSGRSRLFSGILCCRNRSALKVAYNILFGVFDDLTEYKRLSLRHRSLFPAFSHTSAIHRHSAWNAFSFTSCSCAHSHICEIFIQSYLHLFHPYDCQRQPGRYLLFCASGLASFPNCFDIRPSLLIVIPSFLLAAQDFTSRVSSF